MLAAKFKRPPVGSIFVYVHDFPIFCFPFYIPMFEIIGVYAFYFLQPISQESCSCSIYTCYIWAILKPFFEPQKSAGFGETNQSAFSAPFRMF